MWIEHARLSVKLSMWNGQDTVQIQGLGVLAVALQAHLSAYEEVWDTGGILLQLGDPLFPHILETGRVDYGVADQEDVGHGVRQRPQAVIVLLEKVKYIKERHTHTHRRETDTQEREREALEEGSRRHGGEREQQPSLDHIHQETTRSSELLFMNYSTGWKNELQMQPSLYSSSLMQRRANLHCAYLLDSNMHCQATRLFYGNSEYCYVKGVTSLKKKKNGADVQISTDDLHPTAYFIAVTLTGATGHYFTLAVRYRKYCGRHQTKLPSPIGLSLLCGPKNR